MKKEAEETVKKMAPKNEAKNTEKETKKTKEAKIEKVPKATNYGPATFMSALSLTVSVVAIILGFLAFQKANTPLTFLGGGTDGNAANFVEGSIAEVANKVAPSVVSIVTEIKVKSYSFFGQSYDSTSSAAGTGVIVTEDGYILTNKHVIEGATSISVVLADGTTYDDVELAAHDPLNDIAFLKIKDVKDLNAAKLGDSKTINVGQQVIAIGNALGEYQNTVTSGIISGTSRSVTATDSTGKNTETLSDMIQTDAAINPGNSGGPLVNAAGEVIGINTATSTSADNIGFAIPISSVKGMLKQLTETGKASRAYIGVYSIAITPSVAKKYELPVSSGAYVYSADAYSAVISGGPADKAGLQDKDIILSVNGTKVGAAGSVSSIIAEYKPDDTVQLAVLRGGKEIAINVKLGAYSEKK